MFTWLNLIMLFLRLADSLFTWARDRQLIQQGEEKAVARGAARVLERTKQGKAIREKVDSLSDAEEDALWDAMLEAEDERKE